MERQKNNYYAVVAKCGHVGKKNYIPIKFAVCAEDGKEAAKKVRNFARVKHNHKDAILDVKSISLEEYLEIKVNNDNDPYLQCHSKQEQQLIENLKDRVIEDLHNIKATIDKTIRKTKIAYKNKKNKIIEDFMDMEEEEYEYYY